MNTKLRNYLKQNTKFSDNTIAAYARIVERLIEQSGCVTCLDVTIHDINHFIANLPGSIKPQAFAAVRIVYGKLLKAKMPEEFQQAITWYDTNTPKQAKHITVAELSWNDAHTRIATLGPPVQLLARMLLYGVLLSEAVTLGPDDVRRNVVTLPARSWEIPHDLKDDLRFWRDVAQRRNEQLFPKSLATYAGYLRKAGLSASELKRIGIAHAFKIGADAYYVWAQFGITSNAQRARYWRLYGKNYTT